MGMVGSDGPPGGPEAADVEDDEDDEDEVLPDEARPLDTTAERETKDDKTGIFFSPKNHLIGNNLAKIS